MQEVIDRTTSTGRDAGARWPNEMLVRRYRSSVTESDLQPDSGRERIVGVANHRVRVLHIDGDPQTPGYGWS
jgi:hypothetical protein